MIDDVLDLAIPNRDTYSQTCYNRDKTRGGKRKFRQFYKDEHDYAAGAKMLYHIANLSTAGVQTTGPNKGKMLYTLNCKCEGFTKYGEMAVITAQFEEHCKLRPETKQPADDKFCEEVDAHLVTSYVGTIDGIRYHAPAIDIDLPVRVRESSPGKSHLFIDTLLTEDQYMDLLDALVKAEGIVEPGYAAMARNLHCSSLRLPDIVKQDTVAIDGSTVSHIPLDQIVSDRKEKLKDPLAGLRSLVEEMADGT